MVSAWYRVSIGGGVLLLWGMLITLRRQPESPRQPDAGEDRRGVRKWLAWGSLAGIFFALDLGLWHQAIRDAGAGISTFLANLNVFYLTLFGVLFLGDTLSLRYVMLTCGAVLGALLLIDVSSWQQWSPRYAQGIGLGVLSGMAYSGYILCLRQAGSGARALGWSPAFNLGLASLVTGGCLGGWMWLGQQSIAVSIKDLGYLILLAGIAQVAGWSLISFALPRLRVSLSGLLLLLQPVLATIWAWLLFGEWLSGWQIVGAVLTVICIYGGNLEYQRQQSHG
jgi:drug/metabolite transporter (DMT)-like permease